MEKMQNWKLCILLCSDCSPTPPPQMRRGSWAAVSAVQLCSDCSMTPPPHPRIRSGSWAAKILIFFTQKINWKKFFVAGKVHLLAPKPTHLVYQRCSNRTKWNVRCRKTFGNWEVGNNSWVLRRVRKRKKWQLGPWLGGFDFIHPWVALPLPNHIDQLPTQGLKKTEKTSHPSGNGIHPEFFPGSFAAADTVVAKTGITM